MKITHRLVALTAIMGVFAVAGCEKKRAQVNLGAAPPQVVPEDPPPPPLPDLTKAEVDVVFSVETLLAEQKKNPKILSEKYAGKVVEVSGVVINWVTGVVGPALLLRSGTEDFQMYYTTGPYPWLKALPKQTATIRTVIPRDATHLVEWQVIGAKGEAPTNMTAEELVKQAGDKGEGIQKKYGKGLMIVTGTVIAVKNTSDRLTAELQAGSNAKVDCHFELSPESGVITLPESQKAALKQGQKVKVLGQYEFGLGTNRSTLKNSILLEPAP